VLESILINFWGLPVILVPRVLKLSACSLAIMLSLMCREAAAQIPTQIVTGSNAASASSWLAGAHAGYNWQNGTLLYGVETDFQATHLNSSMNGGLVYTPPFPFPNDFAGTTASIDWYGTLRGRLGATYGSLLLYVTGGIAYGNVDLSSTLRAFGVTTYAETVQPKIGGVVGAGAEYLLKPNVMLTFQYQFVDLGRVNIASSATSILCCATASQSATVRAQFQAAMLGLSFRFAPDGSGSPWAGGYAGGHVGGAWGNDASARYSGQDLLNN
jgi:outer membrane immunogenic protein